MRTEDRTISVSKGEIAKVTINQYEKLDELLTNESGDTILTYFNYRSAQIQCQEHKKTLKPRKIPIREKRILAFNLFSKSDLKKLEKDGGKFEELLQENLKLVEKQIEDGEIN